MAFQKAIQVSVNAFGDGTSTSYTIDLLSDPYLVDGSSTLVNWFAQDRKASSPTGILGPSGLGVTVTLSGTVVTVTYDTAPAAGTNNTVSFWLFF